MSIEKLKKFVLKSKTILGVVIAALPDITDYLAQAEGSGLIPEKYQPTVRAVGLALAVVGRWTAKLPLTVIPKP
jgi:hypothetical protein